MFNKLDLKKIKTYLIEGKRDWHDIASLLVNIAIAGFTIFLFFETRKANEQSKYANKTAKEAVDVARIANEETKKQFDIANMPFLQISDLSFIQFEGNTNVKIEFSIQNFGNHTIKIDSIKIQNFMTDYVFENRNYAGFNVTSNVDFSPTYLKDKPFTFYWTSKDILTNEGYSAIKDEKSTMYVGGDIFYSNEASGKQRKYNFLVRMYVPPSREYKLMVNDNLDLK